MSCSIQPPNNYDDPEIDLTDEKYLNTLNVTKRALYDPFASN
jgi:hypothetical protein